MLKFEVEDLLDKNPRSLGVVEPLKCAEEDRLNWVTWVTNIFYNYL
jgi:hypothetical protein